jgi:ferredoxin
MKKDEVVTETLELDDLECIREAAEACPFAAIHIVDLETGEKLI